MSRQRRDLPSSDFIEVEEDVPLCRGLGSKVYDDNKTPHQAFLLCRGMGYTDRQIANFFGTSEGTVQVWKLTYPRFRQALEAGKDYFDAGNVEESLLSLTKHRPKVKTVTKVDDEGKTEVTTTEETLEPDFPAVSFWLRSRHKERWAEEKKELPPNGNPKRIVLEESPEARAAVLRVLIENGAAGELGAIIDAEVDKLHSE